MRIIENLNGPEIGAGGFGKGELEGNRGSSGKGAGGNEIQTVALQFVLEGGGDPVGAGGIERREIFYIQSDGSGRADCGGDVVGELAHGVIPRFGESRCGLGVDGRWKKKKSEEGDTSGEAETEAGLHQYSSARIVECVRDSPS